MTTLRVALLQMVSCGYDQAANLAKGEEYCRRAAAMGADIALFPEMWNIGYTYERHPVEGAPDHRPEGEEEVQPNIWRSPELWSESARADRLERERDALDRWRAQAIGRDSAFVTQFRELARELDIGIALTYLEKWEGGPRNTVSLIDRHGEIALTYAKVHTCDFDTPEAALTPGDGFHVGDLDTAQGAVKVGAMICYDREFPESARALMLGGAELILVPNSCHLEPFRLEQLRVRAAENMVEVAMTNYAAPQLDGHSAAYHPIAFGKGGEPRETLVLGAGEAEGVYIATFDLDELRDYRRREGWGNAFRRPHLYGALTSPTVEPPFVRVDWTGKRWHETRRQG